MCGHIRQSAVTSFCSLPTLTPPGMLSYHIICDSCGAVIEFLGVERYYPNPKDIANNDKISS